MVGYRYELYYNIYNITRKFRTSVIAIFGSVMNMVYTRESIPNKAEKDLT
jgi:hypothetical protein